MSSRPNARAQVEYDAEDRSIRYTQETDGRSTRVELWHDGRAVSRCWIVSQRIRIGCAAVRMDGIGGVGTDGDHRGRGFARRVLEAALRRMNQGDAGLTMLYGIPDFYERFGYATAGPEYAISVDVDARERLPSGWSCRPAVLDDMPSLMRVYEAATALSVGVAVRTERSYAWRALTSRLAEPGDPECVVAIDGSGQIRGYVRLGAGFWAVDVLQRDVQSERVIAEAMAVDAGAAEAVLSECVMLCAACSPTAEAGVRVLIPTPHEGPLYAAAMLRSARLVRTYQRSGGSMARALNVGRLLADLTPELTRRLKESRIRLARPLVVTTEQESVRLRTSAEGVCAEADDGESEPVDAWRVSQANLARLALGALPPELVTEPCPNPCSARVRRLVAALFPERHPHMHLPDRY